MLSLSKITHIYAIGAMFGLVAGTIFYFLQPVHWEGVAIISIGYTSEPAQTGLIEDVSTTLERLKSPSFIQAVAARSKNDAIASLLNVDVGGGLSAKQNRNANSMLITVSGNTADVVRTAIEAIVAELISKHNEILSRYQTDIRLELSRVGIEINQLSNLIAGKSSLRSDPAAVFAIALLQYDLDVKLSRAYTLRDSISSKSIRPTTLIEPVSVTERRMFTSPWRALLFGMLVGVLISVIWVRMRGA